MANVGKREFENLLNGGKVSSHGEGIYFFVSENLEITYDNSRGQVTENNYTEMTEAQENEIADVIEKWIQDEMPDRWADEDPYRAETIYANQY